MPTSKNRVGMRLRERAVPVPLGIAAVIATTVVISFAELGEPAAEDRRVRRIRRRRLELLARGGIVARREARATSRRRLAGGKAFALLRDDVHEARPAHLAHGGERVDQRVDVVAVDRAEVAEAELLEQHARREEGLHALLPLPHDVSDRRAAGRCRRASPIFDAHAVVERIALDRRQVLRHRADVRRDRHLVVVEHDDEVAIRMAGVVQSLVRESGRERAVAEDRDDLEVLAA